MYRQGRWNGGSEWGPETGTREAMGTEDPRERDEPKRAVARDWMGLSQD